MVSIFIYNLTILGKQCKYHASVTEEIEIEIAKKNHVSFIDEKMESSERLLKSALIGFCTASFLFLGVTILVDEWIVYKVVNTRTSHITMYGVFRKCTLIEKIPSLPGIENTNRNCSRYQTNTYNVCAKEWSNGCMNIAAMAFTATLLSLFSSFIVAATDANNAYVTVFWSVSATFFITLIFCVMFMNKEMKTLTYKEQNEGAFGFSFPLCVITVLCTTATSILACYSCVL